MRSETGLGEEQLDDERAHVRERGAGGEVLYA